MFADRGDDGGLLVGWARARSAVAMMLPRFA